MFMERDGLSDDGGEGGKRGGRGQRTPKTCSPEKMHHHPLPSHAPTPPPHNHRALALRMHHEPFLTPRRAQTGPQGGRVVEASHAGGDGLALAWQAGKPHKTLLAVGVEQHHPPTPGSTPMPRAGSARRMAYIQQHGFAQARWVVLPAQAGCRGR